MSEQWVIVVGTLAAGLDQIVGPFPSEQEARGFAIGHSGDDRYEDWCSVALTAPEGEPDK